MRHGNRGFQAMLAKGRLKRGEKNRTEAAYETHLELRKRAGEVLWYAFGAVKFRLADGTFYNPDFAVLLADATLEMHEVKGGFFADDGKVKIKVAAELFPVRFVLVRQRLKRDGGGWDLTRIGEDDNTAPTTADLPLLRGEGGGPVSPPDATGPKTGTEAQASPTTAYPHPSTTSNRSPR